MTYDPYRGNGADVLIYGNVSITTSTGNATIIIGGTAESDSAFIGGCLTICTGAGNASISLTDDDICGNVGIATGTGNATISLVNDFLGSNLGILLSSGAGSVKSPERKSKGQRPLTAAVGLAYYDATDDFVGGISYSHFKSVTT